jgi:hypothetical protein
MPGHRRRRAAIAGLPPPALAALAFALVTIVAGARQASAARLALVVGSNEGHGGDARLRFAETDAQHTARVLVTVGGFAAADTRLLLAPTAERVRAELAKLAERLHRQTGDRNDDLVVFYFSGHADATSLHLGPDSLPLGELKAAVGAVEATASVVVLDACQAGALVRLKGGQPAPVFAVTTAQALPRGLAFLASSSESEMAQESDELAASFFTHYFLSGLRGAADRDRDGRVSLTESFEFASRHTLAATVASAAGPQHPSFRVDLAGDHDITLTFPGRAGGTYGRLRFDQAGHYFVRRSSDAAAVTELVTDGDDEVLLDAGRYHVMRRMPHHLKVADVELRAGEAVTLSGLPTRKSEFGQVVRKGWGVRSRSYGLGVSAGVRSGVAALGPALTTAIVGRVDLRSVSFELRAGAGRSERVGEHVTATTWEAFAALSALRAWDLGALTLSAGAEVGWGAFSQRLGVQETRDLSHAPLFGPTVVLEVPVAGRLCLRLDAEAPVYLVRLRGDGGDELALEPTMRVGLGGSVLF